MDSNRVNVLMIGSDLSVKGGMTSVVESFLGYDFNDNINLFFIPTHISGSKSFKIYFFVFNLMRIIKKVVINRIDIVHMHMSERGSFARKYLIFKILKVIKPKMKIIVHTHGAEFEQYFESSSNKNKNRINNLLTNVDCVITLGEKWNEIIKGYAPNSNSLIFRNAVSIPQKYNKIENYTINILFLAVLIKRKGIIDLINASKKVIQELAKLNIEVKFIIAGDGDEEENAKSLVQRLDVKEYFSFVGWVDITKKQQLFHITDLFVLPSYNEGLPVAILEAISHGIPIIATNVGSIDEAVIDHFNGYLIPPGDTEFLSQSIVRIISNNELEVMGRRSRELAFNKFNSIKYFEEIEKLYLTL